MFAVFDIGGTHTRVGISRNGRTLAATASFATPRNPRRGAEAIRGAIKKLSRGGHIVRVAGGIAGTLNNVRDRLIYSPHLRGWRAVPLNRIFTAALGVRPLFENDAALAALGEAQFGAGRGIYAVGYCTVGTGVGGACVRDGRIDAFYAGVEPGHQIVDPDGPRCPGCGGRGHLEAYVSGQAFRMRFRRAPEAVHGVRVWREAARWLAVGIHNMIVHWSPDCMVLGGPMILGNPAIPFRDINQHLRRIGLPGVPLPPLRRAELGETSGLFGGLANLRMKRIL